MSENTAPEALPEFLNTEPDTTGEGLICPENGDRLSWEDLDRALNCAEMTTGNLLARRAFQNDR